MFGHTKFSPSLGCLPAAPCCLMRPCRAGGGSIPCPASHVPCPGGSEDAESCEGRRQGWVCVLPALFPSVFQLCIKFIKDTLSVEQVCEALQVSVTPVESQRVKNNPTDFGAGAGLTLSLSAGLWGRVFYPCLAQRLSCQLLGTSYQGKGHQGHPSLAG